MVIHDFSSFVKTYRRTFIALLIFSYSFFLETHTEQYFLVSNIKNSTFSEW